MPKYGVDISGTGMHSIELDVSPNAPPLTRVEMEWTVTPGELKQRLEELGGRTRFSQTGARVWARNVPLTRDGEGVGIARIKLWALEPHEARGLAR